MNESLPPEDAVLIQFQFVIFPLHGAFYTFWIVPKTTPPVKDVARGIEYTYLTVGESIELNKGAKLFPKKFSIIYLGHGRVSISHVSRRGSTVKNTEIINVYDL